MSDVTEKGWGNTLFDALWEFTGTNALIRQMVEFDQRKRPTADDILKVMS